MPFSSRNGLNSFNLPFFISSLLSSWVYPSIKDSLWTNLIITSSDFFVSKALKISFNLILFALQSVKNLVTHAMLWSLYWWFPSLYVRNNFSFISSLVSGNSSIILLSFFLVSVLFQRNLGPLYHSFCWPFLFLITLQKMLQPYWTYQLGFFSLVT